jgi:mono/diheme cytochrome c family protein
MPVLFLAPGSVAPEESEVKRILVLSALAAVSASTAVTVQSASAQGTPYKVKDGNKVDEATLNGWRTWRALACERCHGPNQEGMVGPSLINSLKVLTKDEFKTVLLKGRPEKGMPNFDASKQVVDNIDGLYAYLKGRSDGAIKPGRVEKME